MHRSHGVDGDRVLAWSCVVFAHLLAWWLLTRPHGSDTRAEADGLDVVWIEPALPSATMPPRTDDPPRATPSGSKVVRDDARRREVVASAETPIAESNDPPSLSAVFLEQGQAWAKEQHPPGDFARNPLSPRVLSPDRRADRFRMREPITPAAIVAGIGALFGGPGYTTDPCPRIRDNIANLATGAASELLEEELRRHRHLCR